MNDPLSNSLIALADLSLQAAKSDHDRLVVYDAVANLGFGLLTTSSDFDRIATAASEAATAIRAADNRQLEFRELIAGGGDK